MTEAEKQFQRAMLDSVDVCKRKYHYNPTYFVAMLADSGAVGAAKRLLATETVSDGLGTLYMVGRLDLSVEAHVVKPEYAELFTPEEVAIARKRLVEYGYKSD